MRTPLIAPLFDGRLDIVGDIHGEIDALEALLDALDYEPDGRHPDRRRLVFVGDLVDRGPDSPAVVEKIEGLVQAGQAQCILGNHELNILRSAPKSGNEWLLVPDHRAQQPGGEFSGSRIAPPGFKDRCLEFFNTLPLALERSDLRVVHAAWDASAIDLLRNACGSVFELYSFYENQTESKLRDEGIAERASQEEKLHRDALENRPGRMKLLGDLGLRDQRQQMENPIRLLTSGPEQLTHTPFWKSGKWRMCDRVLWWENYREDKAVVVGHYWRTMSSDGSAEETDGEPDLFKGVHPLAWLGPKKNVFCVDYSVGRRYETRRANCANLIDTNLVALR